MAGLVVGWLCWQWATRLLGTSEGLVPVPAACVSCAVVWGLTCGFLGLGALSLELLVLCVPLVTLSLADFAVRIIPNECVLAVLAVHLCRVAMQVAQGSLGLGQALAQVLAGGACALVPLLALTLVVHRGLATRGRETWRGLCLRSVHSCRTLAHDALCSRRGHLAADMGLLSKWCLLHVVALS